jgi:hypothetical protein
MRLLPLVALAAAWYYREPLLRALQAHGVPLPSIPGYTPPAQLPPLAPALPGHDDGNAGDSSLFTPGTPVPPVSDPPVVPPLSAPRGVRNNNPGNIRTTDDKWQGAAATQTDPDFVQFVTPLWGLRALGRILLKYQSAYGLATTAQIITRWAPPNENNTAAYIAAVAARMSMTPTSAMDLHAHPELLARLMHAIAAQEIGPAWADLYPAELYAQGASIALT